MSSQNPPSSAPVVLGGRYEVHRRLARGGMAEVFLARDSALDRPVAVKVLFPEYAADPSFVERFRREAQAAANLTHPNIVGVFDWGSESGTYYIVMEYVDGQSVAQILRGTGPLQPRRVAEVAFETAGALGFAHTRGVVHRDVKPGNILVNSQGVSKVTDFGIARALSSPAEELTQAGSVMGTATYFSPEQAQGFAVDARSDLYSLGVVMYEMLCGRPPFAGDSPVAIAYKHVQELPPPPESIVSTVPPGLSAIVLKLLAKSPDQRYVSADDLRADLRRWLDGQPTAAESASATDLAATTVVAAASAGAAGAALASPQATTVNAATSVAAAATPPTDLAASQNEPPKKSNKTFIIVTTLLLLAIAGLAFWLLQSLGDDTTTEKKPVNPVIGSTQEVATKSLEDQGFRVSVSPAPSDQPVGIVFDQTPKANTLLGVGETVTISVSSGKAKVVVPPVKNKTTADAQALLTDAQYGFKVSVKQVESDIDAGIVVGSNPVEGTEVETGSAIELQVSTGPGAIDIPVVEGKTVAAATTALKDKGFAVATTNVTEASDKIAKDKVIRTDPTGKAKKGATITLVVSSGPNQVKVPAVKGSTESEARSVLAKANLEVTVTFKTFPAGDPNIGRVTASDPVAGTLVAPGSTVDITVGAAASTSTTTSAPPTSTTTTTSP